MTDQPNTQPDTDCSHADTLIYDNGTMGCNDCPSTTTYPEAPDH